MDLVHRTSAEVITYGETSGAEIRAYDVGLDGECVRFELKTPNDRVDVHLKMPGKFMVTNALAAAAVGYVCGLDGSDIKKGLEAFIPVKGRLNILHASSGVNIIDDTYNANPLSMKAAVSTLVELSKGKRKIGCFGDMLELGDQSGRLHEEIGEFMGRANLTHLFMTGTFSQNIANGAKAGGMRPEDICIGTQEDILSALSSYLKPEDWLLVKGSRSTHMENIVNRLMEVNKKG